jgi:sugar/nucleoside kinase (ribokinase family)
MNELPKYEILGVGNPLLDHLLQVSPEYLDSISGEKYGMEIISYQDMIQLIEKSGSIPKLVAGGSCANAVKGLASLGRKCALAGKIGSDPNGEKVIKVLQDLGVVPLVSYTTTPTAHATCLITPDGKRTCRTYLGAATEMVPEDLDPIYFRGVKLVHIEGYSLLYPGLTKRAMELAKESGALVSFDLGSFEVVETYSPLIRDMIEKYVDITFSNEDEILSLTGKHPEEGCKELQKISPIAVVMMGKHGCWVADSNHHVKCPAFVVEPIDTTGAGDLFASGFLHGYLSGMDIETCSRWGSIIARAVVQVVGAEIPVDQWPQIKQELLKSSSIPRHKEAKKN